MLPLMLVSAYIPVHTLNLHAGHALVSRALLGT